MKNKTILATLAALMAQIIFGFSFLFTKIALGFTSPITLIANRYMIAFVGLSLVMFFLKNKIKLTKNIWKLVLMSFFQPVLYFIFESYGIKLTTSAFSSIMISLVPIAAMISGIIVLKEIPSPMQYLFVILSVCGVAIYSLEGGREGVVTPVGFLLLLGAVISAVAYNTMSRKISMEFTAFERTYAMAVVGLITFSAISFFENIHNPAKMILPFQNPAYLISILYLGVSSSVIAFLLLNYANTHLPVTKTMVFANFATVVSVIAGAIFLNEKISLTALIAILIIITGVLGVQMLEVKKKE